MRLAILLVVMAIWGTAATFVVIDHGARLDSLKARVQFLEDVDDLRN